MKRWTVDDLRVLGACNNQVALFAATFPNGATADDVGAAVAAGLDVQWLVRRVVARDVWRAYEEAEAPLWRAYAEVEAPLWRAYEEAVAPLWRAYEEALVPLRRAYLEARAPLLRAYLEARAPLWRAYEEARAPLLANALRTEEAA